MTKVVFNWTKHIINASWHCEMPRGICLFVSPERSDGFGNPKRGTKWRYGASHTKQHARGGATISRWGRDTYDDLRKTREDAMRAAEAVYRDPASGVLKP